MHTAFYHVWYIDGRRYQKYVRRSEVAMVSHTLRKAAAEREYERGIWRVSRKSFKECLAFLRQHSV
jgi:hypothetical protein